MGRKKKPSKPDSRGYSQQSTPVLKQQTHNDMKELLQQFSDPFIHNNDNNYPSDSAAAGPSDRFPSKLSNIMDKLEELGFTEAQIEQTALALQYEITLENALDYLCLNIDTLELPSLFTEVKLREDLNTETTADSLVIVSNNDKGIERTNGEIEFEENVLDVNRVNKRDQEDIVDEDKQKQKEWLLRQYEYEEDGDDSINDNVAIDDTTEQARILTPEEQDLFVKETELKELQDDLNNDANNYMRSKQEIKALQIQAKKLRQQVEGMKKKMERTQRKQQLEAFKSDEVTDTLAHTLGKSESEDENGGRFFDLFEQSQEDDAVIEEEKPDQHLPKKMLDYTIPKGWTGSTPEKKLNEICKKQKLPKPKYTKLPRNEGFCLSVVIKKNQSPVVWEAYTNDFLHGSSLKDYMATHALYAIDSKLPLYQLFPHAFRILWLSWVNEELDKTNLAQQVEDEFKRKRVNRLVSLIADLQRVMPKTKIPAEDGKEEYNNPMIENWEDDNETKITVRSSEEPTQEGRRLQRDFTNRQATDSYTKMKNTRDSLPMASYRKQILDTISENAVTILAAETGAGKTTQCPQFILEDALLSGHGDHTQIICTQPRRVAATSVAERVADEMCDTLGKKVGYQIRMEAKRSSQTKLLFCTTGIILRRLQDDPYLSNISHILVDEVHERQQHTDVLLIILRQLLNTTRPDLKVILMSATLDSDLFCSFFNGAPLISVPGRTFPVSNYYLEDLIEATHHVIEEGSRYAKYEGRYTEQASLMVTQRGGDKRKEVVDLSLAIDPIEISALYESYSTSTRRSMERVDENIINYDLIEDVLELLLLGDNSSQTFGIDLSSGSILVFLPGLGEIKSMTERLEGSRHFNSKLCQIIPMHSTLSSHDQRRAFIPSRLRKIILSTNIAETSVTIPDVVCVIDTGKVKELRQSKRFMTSQLVTDWCSQASAKQRAGRAGRIKSGKQLGILCFKLHPMIIEEVLSLLGTQGICLKLYSSNTANNIMQKTSLPELQRGVALEEICLSILASGFATSCAAFLLKAPQPPTNDNIQAALRVLHDIGAVETKGKSSESLTPLGCHLAKLPVNVRLGKMLLYGALFQCIDPILTICASLSSQSPFANFMNDEAVAKAKQKAFSDPDSDMMTYCNVWNAYSKACSTSSSAGRTFCQKNYLNHVSLREIGSSRKQFVDLLSAIGFLKRGCDGITHEKKLALSSFNRQSKKLELVHAIVCAGLYPNIARLDHEGSGYALWHKDERLHFNASSVNASKKCFLSNEKWVVFDEKFGTAKRTSVSATAFVHPLALILFGTNVIVKHTERLVIVDDWIQIAMAAQTSVMLREIKKQLSSVLEKMIVGTNTKETGDIEVEMIEGLCKILAG